VTINATPHGCWRCISPGPAGTGARTVPSCKAPYKNDLIKEYLSAALIVWPRLPRRSRLIAGCGRILLLQTMPKWNRSERLFLPPARSGASPSKNWPLPLPLRPPCLDALRPRVPKEDFPKLVAGSPSLCNAGIRFVTEMCKMRAFGDLWDEICLERYGVEDPKIYRRFRYWCAGEFAGTGPKQQARNNVYRILIEDCWR